MRIVYEEKRVIIDYLDDKGPTIYKTKLDALFGYVQRELQEKKKGPFLNDLGITSEYASRVRNGHEKMPELWYLRINEYSGIPISELRKIMASVSPTVRHERARK